VGYHQQQGITMARNKSIEIAALNIVIHPHSPERYLKLFHLAHKHRVAGKYRANQYGMFGTMQSVDVPEEGLRGLFYRFLDLDPDAPWLNIRKHKPAEEDELSDLNIPEHLKPGLKESRWFFDPKIHRLFIEVKSEDGTNLGPTTAQKLFHAVLNDIRLQEEFGEVAVTVEPSEDGIEAVLGVANLRRLKMVITPPNADTLSRAQQTVMKNLKAQNAKREEVVLVARNGEPLKPSKKTKTLARVASSNGYATSVGDDANGKRTEESTKKHPWKERFSFNPKVQHAYQAFTEVVRSFTKKIRARSRQ
jgi:hypothetical protein